MGVKNWKLAGNNLDSTIDAIQRKYALPRLIALFFASRGIEDVQDFLNPRLSNLSDPYRFPRIRDAAKRLWEAIAHKETILIHGDYDTDGITASALLALVLRQNGANVHSFIPHRFDDGYGVTPESLQKALDTYGPASVLVTVDCGITSCDAVNEAVRRGIDVIVTDHHEAGPQLPDAIAIVNPKVYPELEDLQLLAGAGAAFKLSHAFIKYGRENNLGGFQTRLEEVLDYVALGTVADIVPLLGENRIMVKYGIEALRRQIRPGVRALIESSRLRSELTPADITFRMAPRINAAGRMGDAMRAARLLMTTDDEEAERLARELEEENRARHTVEGAIVEEAMAMLSSDETLSRRRTLVLAREGWHPGVLGIAASRICERTGKPCALLTIQGEKAHGSARSVGDFPLYDALASCREHLTAFGGHAQAAGLSLHPDQLSALADGLEAYAAARGDMPFPILRLDCKLTPRGVSIAAAEAAETLAPFGQDNPSPLFGLFHMTIDGIRAVGGGKHLRLSLSRDGVAVTAMRFSTTREEFPYNEGDCVDLAVALSVGQYQGKPSLSTVVREIRPANLDQASVLSDMRLYERCRRGDALTPEQAARLLPTRDEVGAVYRQLRRQDGQVEDRELLLARTGGGLRYGQVCCAVDAMEELGLLRRQSGPPDRLALNPAAGKQDLSSSRLLRSLEQTAHPEQAGSAAVS